MHAKLGIIGFPASQYQLHSLHISAGQGRVVFTHTRVFTPITYMQQ